MARYPSPITTGMHLDRLLPGKPPACTIEMEKRQIAREAHTMARMFYFTDRKLPLNYCECERCTQ